MRRFALLESTPVFMWGQVVFASRLHHERHFTTDTLENILRGLPEKSSKSTSHVCLASQIIKRALCCKTHFHVVDRNSVRQLVCAHTVPCIQHIFFTLHRFLKSLCTTASAVSAFWLIPTHLQVMNPRNEFTVMSYVDSSQSFFRELSLNSTTASQKARRRSSWFGDQRRAGNGFDGFTTVTTRARSKCRPTTSLPC